MVEHVSTGARHNSQPIKSVGAGGWRDAEFGGDLLRLIGHARIFRPSKLRVSISANQSG
jgi:hypothetical protein